MITSILKSVINEASIAPFVTIVKNFYASYKIALLIALAVICLIVGFFGRRISGVVRVVIIFSVGFVAAVYWIVPLLKSSLPQVPGYAVGIAVGIFAAVMSRFIYDAVYVGVIAFDVYNICYNAIFFVELTSLTKGNLEVCLAVTFAVALIALAVRKYLEMIITSAAAGIGIAFVVENIYSYSGLMGLAPLTAILVIGIALAVPMFCYQYYNRVIY